MDGQRGLCALCAGTVELTDHRSLTVRGGLPNLPLRKLSWSQGGGEVNGTG